jgi:CubicO group peptidase (beta-lactamase class C family)
MDKNFETIFSTYAHRFSGTCLVSKGTTTVFSAVEGFANKDFSIPNTLDTMFDIASVTKTFTAVAVIMLVEKGLLSLDDRIAEIIDLSGTRIASDVTIEQLLNHTSGIADDADEEAGEDYSAIFSEKPNYSVRNCIDFLPQFAYKEPNFKAGTNVRYNNCAFVLLGLALEKLTETNYRDFIMEKVFIPCGMKYCGFPAKDEVNPNTAEGYYAVNDINGSFMKWKKNIYSYPPIGTPDGGAYTTVGDLVIFMKAIRECKLLSQEYSEMMTTPHCSFSRQAKHGGIWRTGYAFEFIEIGDEIFCMYKEGGNPGVDAIFSYYPGLDITLNILSNQTGSDNIFWKLYNKMQDIIFEIWRLKE